jgi:RNA polymerase sigma-70 factor (ECF subfamily)
VANSKESVNSLVDHLFRRESARLVAILTRLFGPANIERAEDIVQDTLIEAMNHWTDGEIPDNPAAWLTQVARRKTLNELKRIKVVQDHREAVKIRNPEPEQLVEENFLDTVMQDSQLRMIFTCCHPLLSLESQLVMTLKILCGFSIKEVSQALLTREEVINKRLYRAKEKIRSGQVPFHTPPASDERRLRAVCLTLYLLFNEGYNSSQRESLIRKDLCAEAMRLTKVLTNNFDDHTELWALLSLMCFHTARFDARLDQLGAIVIFEDQDRTQWNQELIAKGFYYLGKASVGTNISEYHLEAGIAAEHCQAKNFGETDWNSIYQQYELLYTLNKNPIVKLNMAIVYSHLGSLRGAIEKLEEIVVAKELERYYLLPATLGVFYVKEKNYDRALHYLTLARQMTGSPWEKDFLNRKIGECSPP